MAISYLQENFIFRVMTEDVVEKCKNYTCKKDTDIEEFFKSEYKDYNRQLLGKSYCFLTRVLEKIEDRGTVSEVNPKVWTV